MSLIFPRVSAVFCASCFTGTGAGVKGAGVLPPGTKAAQLVVPWKRAQEMAKYGGVDLLLSLRITPERATYLDFTTHRAFPNPIVIPSAGALTSARGRT